MIVFNTISTSSGSLTFQDANGNPLPAAVRVDFYNGSSIAPGDTPFQSLYTQVGGSVTPGTLTNGTTYTCSFYGTWAPANSVTFTASSTSQAVTVTGYQSPTLSQTNFALSQAGRWVRGAFGSSARQDGGVAFNLAFGLSYALLTASQQIQSVIQALRLPTSVSTSIDTWLADFFGLNLPRQSAETDSAYIARGKANLSAKKGLRSGIQTVAGGYGTAWVNEPWNTAETGGYGTSVSSCGYGAAGGYGSQKPLIQVFVEPNAGVNTTQLKSDILGSRAAGIRTQVYEIIDGTQPQRLTGWLVNTGPNREGVVSVPADGTSASVTFPAQFGKSVGAIRFGLANYSGTDNASLRARVSGTPTVSGFTVIVSGGQSGSTVNLHYRAAGDPLLLAVQL